MNQEFEDKLLLKQNSEMVSRMQWYRRENQQLIQKNHDLNLWVQNLSQVFGAIGAAWKTITNNEQALFNLMKKRGDSNSKALISKYVSHFRTFDEIINNLGEKITNSGHSKEATIDAKARLNSFVQNYELFFKEIVDSYFKFNDEYLHWMTQLKNKPQLPQTLRTLSNKEIQNRLKVKEFESFMNQFRGRFKIYESQNQHKLLDGIIMLKNQQINSINQLNQKQSRRIHLMTNYSTSNAQTIIQGNEKDYQCFCGGLQLQYFRKQWQNHLEEMRIQNNKTKIAKSTDSQTHSGLNRDDYELLQFQKQKLFDRVTNLQEKIQKMKIQSRLSQQMVINSTAFEILHKQAQQLMDYTNDLSHKISNHYNILYQIQKARDEQILQLKHKLQKSETSSVNKIILQSPKIKVESNLVQFKTNVTTLIKQLKNQFNEINSKISSKDDILLKSKEYTSSLKKQNQDLIKKVQFLQASKNAPPQFRHQKFNEVQKRITQILNDYLKQDNNKEKHNIQNLWKEFIDYVKSRDKKVKDLQSVIKKRQKQMTQKEKLLGVLQQSLKETQSIYISTQSQLKKFNQFVAHTQKELHSLSEKNVTLKTQYQQEKALLSYKMRSYSEGKLKMEQKLKIYQSIQDQINEVRKITKQAEQNYDNWIKQQQEKIMSAQLMIQQKDKQIQHKKIQLDEKEKIIKKLIEEKEKLKSEFNKLGAKMNAIQEKSEVGVIKMQLEQYKRKIMCSCSRDQQRSIVLTTCPHAFCKKCIEDMNNSRNRKCPLCGIKFGKSDIHDIILS